MNRNWQRNHEIGIHISSDFLRFISGEMVLNNLISRTVAEALQEFLLDLKISERSSKTVLFYKDRLKWFVDFIKPSTIVSNITTSDIKQFFNNQNSNYIYAYHAKYRALRAFFNWCIRQKYLLQSPLTFSAPKLPDVIKPVFTDEELKRILNVCTGSLGLRNKAMIMVLIDTGIRREELARIKLSDINIDARLILITGKGRKQRLLHISPVTLKTIWQYLKQRRNPNEHLWLTEESKPITGDGIGQMLQGLMKSAGISGHKASCHVFRHTFANNRLDEGMNPLDLQYLLGHTSLKMVENYSRAHKQRRALKALEQQRPVEKLLK